MGKNQVLEGTEQSPPETIEQRVNCLLGELLRPENRAALERFRFRGSTNRVYRIPLDPLGVEFIIVKLLPSRWVELKNRRKRVLRNLLYGEHDVSTGGRRVQMEIERAREWRSEGLPVAPLIETAFPGVRVFLGLPYPTLYTILTDQKVAPERKLQILAKVVGALSFQHQHALVRGKKSLVHRDPGPWNIMFDVERERTYWFDLEHPAEYPKMTLEALMARAIRIFLYGVVEHVGDYFDDIARIMVEKYEITPVLWDFVESTQRRGGSPLANLLQRVRRRRTSGLRQQLVHKLGKHLEAKTGLRDERFLGSLAS